MAKQNVFDEVEQAFGRVPSWLREVPETALTGLWGLMRDFYLAETAVPNKYKEPIAAALLDLYGGDLSEAAVAEMVLAMYPIELTELGMR